MVKEAFSIRRVGNGHFELRSESADAAGPPKGGNLEVDANFRPVRGLHWEGADSDRTVYELAGSPLTFSIKRGSVPWKHEVAAAPIDIYLDGPGMVSLTAACRIEGEVTLRMLGTDAG